MDYYGEGEAENQLGSARFDQSGCPTKSQRKALELSESRAIQSLTECLRTPWEALASA